MRSRPLVAATLLYLVATVGMTWPLALGIARDIPSDLGDSALNCWILGWDMSHMLRFLKGDLGAFRGFWSANIYHPEPLALAYSEHLLAQALQALPIYALTGQLVLSYNLLFLSTFVLSGLGAFLLVRELTGSPRAAFVAGLVYAFAPYRIGQYNHLQVLSSQWMPFTLFGLRRYFETRRPWPLAGAALALVAQNLSCGYFLLFFAPFVAAYAVYECVERGLLADLRVWRDLALAAAAVVAATVPILLPYSELRAAGGILRELWEVESFSADVLSYLTAPPDQQLWGRFLQVFPKPEAALFPSCIPLLLAAVGISAHARSVWASARRLPIASFTDGSRRAGRVLALILFSLAAFQMLVVLGLLAGLPMSLPGLSMRSLGHAVRTLVLASIALLVISPRARGFVRGGQSGSTLAFFLLAALAALALSLGPTLTTGGRTIGAGPYAWLYHQVPGFDGLRVPARLAMLVALFLAVLAGFGARVLESVAAGGRLLLAIGILFLFEATAAPLELNRTFKDPAYKRPPDRLLTGAETPAIYRAVVALPADAVLAEFPFGSEPWEVRYMFYSTTHWRRLVNGFSGGRPRSYAERAAVLERPFAPGEKAWEALASAGTTHAIVHEWAWRHGRGRRVSEWLEAHGARCLATEGEDVLYELPR